MATFNNVINNPAKNVGISCFFCIFALIFVFFPSFIDMTKHGKRNSKVQPSAAHCCSRTQKYLHKRCKVL
ncbi:MAG: hypothetical protein IJ607_07325 [Bacteroidaceae bacterium]|nr:hypothetical protein [Bacteroidaceae bacterium]